MKRWLAGLLSVMMLFSGTLCLAEETGAIENADLQETVVSVEGENLGTLSENLRFLVDLTKNEEIRDLLRIEDVKNVASEIIWRSLVWMVQNRPVTMKILAELGVTESDRRCIEKIWDSADRVAAAFKKHAESEDGRRLQAEAEAVKNDPELQETWANFMTLATSEDLTKVLDALNETLKTEMAEIKDQDGTLTREALNRNMDRSSFTGRLIYEALSLMDQSEWARESVPELLTNENLWRFLSHLSVGNKELDDVLQEECILIMSDPEINVFFQQTLQEALALYRALAGSETEKTQTTGEEVTP